MRKKQQNIQDHDPAECGDAYLWLALDAHTKVIISYLVGKRTGESAKAFVADVRGRVINRPQITTDSFAPYADAISSAFGVDVDYVMMNKKADGYPVQHGRPDLTPVTTNHVERCNLTVRTQLSAATPAARTPTARSWNIIRQQSPCMWLSTIRRGSMRPYA